MPVSLSWQRSFRNVLMRFSVVCTFHRPKKTVVYSRKRSQIRDIDIAVLVDFITGSTCVDGHSGTYHSIHSILGDLGVSTDTIVHIMHIVMNHTDEGTGSMCVDGHSGTYERVGVARMIEKQRGVIGCLEEGRVAQIINIYIYIYIYI